MKTKIGTSFGLALLLAIGVIATMLALGTFNPTKVNAANIERVSIEVDVPTVYQLPPGELALPQPLAVASSTAAVTDTDIDRASAVSIAVRPDGGGQAASGTLVRNGNTSLPDLTALTTRHGNTTDNAGLPPSLVEREPFFLSGPQFIGETLTTTTDPGGHLLSITVTIADDDISRVKIGVTNVPRSTDASVIPITTIDNAGDTVFNTMTLWLFNGHSGGYGANTFVVSAIDPNVFDDPGGTINLVSSADRPDDVGIRTTLLLIDNAWRSSPATAGQHALVPIADNQGFQSDWWASMFQNPTTTSGINSVVRTTVSGFDAIGLSVTDSMLLSDARPSFGQFGAFG